MWLRPSYFSPICLNTSLKWEFYVELWWMNVFASGWVYARIHAVSCGATTTETRNPQILCFKCSDSSRCRKQRDGQIQSSVGNHSNSSDFQVKISCNLQFPFSVCFRLCVLCAVRTGFIMLLNRVLRFSLKVCAHKSFSLMPSNALASHLHH